MRLSIPALVCCTCYKVTTLTLHLWWWLHLRTSIATAYSTTTASQTPTPVTHTGVPWSPWRLSLATTNILLCRKDTLLAMVTSMVMLVQLQSAIKMTAPAFISLEIPSWETSFRPTTIKRIQLAWQSMPTHQQVPQSSTTQTHGTSSGQFLEPSSVYSFFSASSGSAKRLARRKRTQRPWTSTTNKLGLKKMTQSPLVPYTKVWNDHIQTIYIYHFSLQ